MSSREIPITAGSVTPITFDNAEKITTRWQISIIGRAVGTVRLKAKAHKSDVFESINGVTVIDPTVRRTLIVKGRLDAIEVDDTGNTGNFTLNCTALN